MNKVFIGSSSESLQIARAVQREIKRRKHLNLQTKIWEQNVINLGDQALVKLTEVIQSCRYAIFIFNDDDSINVRGSEQYMTRANVILEYGLAIGILGIQNCFIFKSENATIPSDLHGITYSDYSNDGIKEDIRNECAALVEDFEATLKQKTFSEHLNPLYHGMNIVMMLVNYAINYEFYLEKTGIDLMQLLVFREEVS